MSREVTVDRDLCMGSGHCSFYAPQTFDLDDVGVALVLDPDGDADDAVEMATRGCPTRAISVSSSD